MSARTYRAGTMKEALAQVRRDLGGDAVILGTREVRRRRLFGLGTRELIEVTASRRPAGRLGWRSPGAGRRPRCRPRRSTRSSASSSAGSTRWSRT